MNIIEYTNGNANIKLSNNGTRVIEYENELQLDYPLNIDIRVSTQCAFGYNPKTKTAFCSFCHESATTDGTECDYETLKNKLNNLPKGIELAIGANNITPNLINFIEWCNTKQYIVNLTINQGHVNRDVKQLKHLINNELIKGLGISYRSKLKFNIPTEILNYQNTVFHVIAGINDIKDVIELKHKNVSKILILGEKDFGFNEGNVDLNTLNHKQWKWWVHKLFTTFNTVSFDNLALEQLNIQRFFTENNWNMFNQHEHSFYINAVTQEFAPSSRNPNKIPFKNISVKKYFCTLQK